MVNPINVWLIPNFAAILLALSTTTSPPITIPTAPITMNKRLFHTGIILISSAASISSLATAFPSLLAFRALQIISPIKPAKRIRKMTPSACPNDIGPIRPRTKSKIAQITENGKSLFKVALLTATGVMIAHTPITIIRLKIFDPITLLTASAFLFAMEAVTDTAASGSDVPIATIVSPIIMDGTLNFLAILELPSTKISAPFTRNTNPITRNNIASGNAQFVINSVIIISFFRSVLDTPIL